MAHPTAERNLLEPPSRVGKGEQAALRFHVLTGPQFDDALSGTFDASYQRLTKAWLKSPKLKYYMQRSCLVRREDTRVFFLATVKAPEENLQEAVAALEIDFEGAGRTTAGLKYVSVREDWRKQGLAMKLYEMLIEHLSANQLRLYRTRPGAQTPAEFTQAGTRMLQAHQVDWFSREL
jgi:GNAT superfamily N-acetyltransferase